MNKGSKNYFSSIINYLDLLVILGSLFTILIYFKVHSILEEIEDISFAFTLLLRNFSQLLRLIVLMKNRNSIRRNIDESKSFSHNITKEFISLEKTKNETLSFMDDGQLPQEIYDNSHNTHELDER